MNQDGFANSKQQGVPGFDGDDATWAAAVSHMPTELVKDRASSLASDPPELAREPTRQQQATFWPQMPKSLEETGLRRTQVEALVLKYLLNVAVATGRDISRQIALPFRIIERQLYEMKDAQLVALKSGSALADYNYELTPFGVERARRHLSQGTYFGAAPVTLEQYEASVAAQSIRRQPLTMDSVRGAYHDMIVSETLLNTIGEALNMGRGIFLHGNAGNGKSSLAERISRAYSEAIWIPRAISVGGEVVRLFDSIQHQVLPDLDDPNDADSAYDRRWVRVRRPTIVVGGELGLESFDVVTNPVTGISEAPLQLKANAGTLVIDDFGRNRFRPEELLNRLVVPMERGCDSLHLESGRTFRVPFDCLMVFSSNLEPEDLVDEAFLRRIPFKIDIQDPSETEFSAVFTSEAHRLGLKFDPRDIEYLLEKHYRATGAPLRFCHPRDLLNMVANACAFHKRASVATRQMLDEAVSRSLMIRKHRS